MTIGPVIGAKPAKLVRAERCENCKWAVPAAPEVGPGAQVCHGGPPGSQMLHMKHPETGRQMQQQITFWPLVGGEDWCGAWKPRISMVQ